MHGGGRQGVVAWPCAALALALALLGVPGIAWAVAADPAPVEVTQPDGSTVTLVTHGDERFSYVATEGGTLVQQDAETETWREVVAGDGTIELGEPLSHGEASESGATAEALASEDARDAYAALAGGVEPPSDAAAAPSDADVIEQDATTTGRCPLLLIVVGFEDTPYSGSYDWGQTVFGEGGLSSYYLAMSDEAFTFVPAQESFAAVEVHDAVDDGVVHVTLAEWEHGNWHSLGTDNANEHDNNPYMLKVLKAAAQAADPYVDFSAYDTDGDGSLSTDELALCFVVAGYEGAVLPGPSSRYDGQPVMWAHAWELGASGTVPLCDNVRVNSYIAVSEQVSTAPGTAPARQEPWTVIAHELGHYLGLPDLYPASATVGAWDGYAVGHLSLMALGEWSRAGDAYVAGALDAWSRYDLGWFEPLEVSEEGVYTVGALGSADAPQALLVRVSETESYLIENREPGTFDAGLFSAYGDAPSGIVIWHIDESALDAWRQDNTVNDADHRPAVMPVFAEYDEDGSLALSSAGGTPNTGQALWSASVWKQVSKGASDVLYLSAYDEADDPSERSYSGVWVQFLDDAGATMRLRIGFSDENPFDTEEPDDEDLEDEEQEDPEDEDWDDEDSDDEDSDEDEDGDWDEDEDGDWDEVDDSVTDDLESSDAIAKDTGIPRPTPHPAAVSANRLPETADLTVPWRTFALLGAALAILGRSAYSQKRS